MTLVEHSYGTSGVKLMKVVRHRDRHEIKDFSIAIRLEGDFEPAPKPGENGHVLAGDAIRIAIYALASRFDFAEVEEFGLILTDHFLGTVPSVTRARVFIEEELWSRLMVREKPHRHSFLTPGGERRIASISCTREETRIEAGFEGLALIKTSGTNSPGFLRDGFTAAREAPARVLATSLTARWIYGESEVPFAGCWRGIRRTLLEAFAEHECRSISHTLNAMGEAVLAEHERVVEVSLTMPDRHHEPVDLSGFGLENRGEIFAPAGAPHGVATTVLRR